MNLASGQRSRPGSAMMAGSLKRLKRKGSTAAGLSGPPRLKSTTAIRFFSRMRLLRTARPPAAHECHEPCHVLGRGRLQDTVAEVEDEGTSPPAREDARGGLLHRLP